MRDRLHRFALGITIVLVLSGCEYQNRGITMESPPKPLRLARAETTYKISIEDRARVVRGFDVDALERLLQMVIPEMRGEILAHFQVHDRNEHKFGMLVQFYDPQVQAVLEEVWAPMWDEVNATDEQIAQNAYGFPGREIARQRRDAARAHRPGA